MDYSLRDAFKALKDIGEEIEVKKIKEQSQHSDLDEEIASYRDHKATRLVESVEVDLSDLDEVEEIKGEIENEKEESPIEQIVDPSATITSELKGSYIGSAILQCPTCKTLIYKEIEKLAKEEDTPEDEPAIYNVGEECPHCGAVDGFELIGQVASLDVNPDAEQETPEEEEKEEAEPIPEPAPEEEAPTEDNEEEKPAEDEEVKEESLNETEENKNEGEEVLTEEVEKVQWNEDENGEVISVTYKGKTLSKGDKVADDYVTGFNPETNTIFLDEDPEVDGGRDYSAEDVFSFLDRANEQLHKDESEENEISTEDEQPLTEEKETISAGSVLNKYREEWDSFENPNDMKNAAIACLDKHKEEMDEKDFNYAKMQFGKAKGSAVFGMIAAFITGDAMNPNKEHKQNVKDLEGESLQESQDSELSYSFKVYSTDEDGNEIEPLIDGEFDNKEDAIEFAKAQRTPTHVVYVPNFDPDDNPDWVDKGEYGDFEVVWTSINESLDEESFDKCVNYFINEKYDNIDSYKTTGGSITNDELIVEGVIKFKSGKERPT